MAVKAIRMYQSEDGKVHASQGEAIRHNAQQKAMSKVKMALANATPSMQMSLLHMDLTNSPEKCEALRNALNDVLTYHRNHGKLKKTAVAAKK